MKHILLILLVASVQLGAFAQDSLTLARCRSMALQHNRRLASAKVQREKAAHELLAAKANFLPKFDLNAIGAVSNLSGTIGLPSNPLPIYSFNAATGGYVPLLLTDGGGNVVGLSQYAEFPAMSVKYDVHKMFNASMSVVQPIYMGGKITAGCDMAQIAGKMADENMRLAESEVRVAVDEAYALALKAREMVAVAKSYETSLVELRRIVESAVRNGVRTRNDLMKVEVNLNRARLSITRAENASGLALMNLCRLVGLPLNAQPLLATPDLSRLEAMDISTLSVDSLQVLSRPEYSMMKNNVELARRKLTVARSEFLPSVAAFASGGYTNGGKMTIEATGSLYGTQRIYDNPLAESFSAGVGVTLSMPLFHFGERRGKIRSAKTSVLMAEIDLADSREKMTLELFGAYNTLKEQVEAVAIAQRSVEQAEENLRLSQSAFKSGVETLSDHLEARALWQSAHADEIDARAQLLVAQSKYLKAAGF